MKRILIVLGLIGTIILLNTKSESIIIPSEAIRFRVIANSDSKEDQQIKKAVKNNLQVDVMNTLKSSNNLEEGRAKIQNNLMNFSKNVEQTLQENRKNVKYDINYGMNYFPEKEYKGVTYPEGEYESLVVTLGNGKGANFWCVLFPPLCLLEAEEGKTTEVEYKSFVKETLDRYF